MLFLLTALISFSTYAQLPQEGAIDSTYKPVFYGKVNNDTIFGFSYEQTKDLMQDVQYAILADSIIQEQDSLIQKLNALNKSQKEQINLQKDLVKACEDGQVILEEINKNNEESIKEEDKKIKWYKIKLKIVPALSAISTAAAFILLTN